MTRSPSIPGWPARLARSLRRGAPRPRRRPARLPLLERLDDRTLLTTFTVTSLADSGAGSLRQAVLDANAAAGADTIDFAAGLTGTIGLTSGELAITDAVTIAGPGAEVLTVDGQGSSRIFNVDDGNSIPDLDVTIDGLTLTGGSTSGSGGAIFNAENLTVADSLITGSFSGGGITAGGGIGNVGTLNVSGSTLSNNSAHYGFGAGLFNAGTATLTDSTVSGNYAFYGGGGGIGNAPSGTLTITRSTLSDNGAFDGGGLNNVGMAALINSTISGNYVRDRGGAIFNNTGTLTLLNSTVTASSAPRGGLYNTGTATLNNTIVANSSGEDVSNFGTLTGSHNLIEDGSGGLGDTIAADPNLGPLKDNGGPTLTHALRSGSPALDAGDNALAAGLTTDQRGPGFPRLQGPSVDIGSFERPPFDESLVVTTLTDEDDATSDPTAGTGTSLREAIIYANGLPGADTITFAPGLTGTIALVAGALEITDSVTIAGPGLGVLTIDGQGESRIFVVDDGDSTPDLDVTIDGLTLTGGSSFGGGAILTLENLTVANSLITGNAAFAGGAIANGFFYGGGGTLSLVNSTVADNFAFYGGGVLNFFSTAILTNSTVSGNVATVGGGLLNSGTATLNNTIVANSSGGDVVNNGTLTGSHNLVEDGGDGLPDTIVADPLLGPLQANGGPTRTHALLPGSPAIDAGDNALAAGLTTDQRGSGFPRIQNGTVDIGAYERAAPPNAPPVNTVPLGTVTGYENVAIAITGISVADPDAGSAPVQMTLSVLHGTLAVADNVAGGLTVGDISGNGTATVVLTGSLAQINATLAASGALIYTPTTGYVGSDTLTVATSDLGNTGSGGALTDTDQVSIYILSTLEQVSALIALIQQDIDAGILSNGQGTSMINSALKKVTETSGLSKIDKFIADVQKLVQQGKLSQAHAAPLLEAAALIRQGLTA